LSWRDFFSRTKKPAVETSGHASPGELSIEEVGQEREAPTTRIVETEIVRQIIALGREPQPKDIVGMRTQARAGLPEQLYSLYDEMPRFGLGPQVTKAREAVKGSRIDVRAYPEEYQDTDDKSREATFAREVADACRREFAPFTGAIIDGLFDKFLYGIGALEVVVAPGAARNGCEAVTSVVKIPPRRFRMDPYTQRWDLMPLANSYETVSVAQLMESGSLIFVEEGGGTLPIDQRGLYWQCLIPWTLMQFGIRWWGKFIELFGIPPRSITYPASDPTAKKEAEAIGRASGAQGFSAIPDTMKMDFQNAAFGTRGNSTYHESLIEFCRRWFDAVICGHSQSSGVQPGAGSIQSAEKADEDFIRITNARSASIATDIRAQLYVPYVRRNFGAEAVAFAPTISMTMAREVDIEKFSRMVLNLYLANAGESISVAEVLRRVGLSVAKPTERNLGISKGATANVEGSQTSFEEQKMRLVG